MVHLFRYFMNKAGAGHTTLYELIDELRSRGAPIAYSKSAKSFFYSQPYDIAVTCTLRPLTFIEEKENAGGVEIFFKILFSRTLLSDLSMVTLPC